MKTLEKVLKRIDSINEYLGKGASVICLVLMFLVTSEVVLRYVFLKPTNWGFEVSMYLLLALTTLGVGYAFIHEGHVKVDIFWNRFRPRARAVVDLITSLLIFLFAYVLLIKGWQLAWHSYVHHATSMAGIWEPPLWPSQMLLPIAAVLLILAAAVKFIRDFVYVVTGRRPAELVVHKGIILQKKEVD